MTARLALGVAAVALAAALGAQPGLSSGHAVAVRIQVTTYANGTSQTASFSLTCDPTGGTLPLAAQVCRAVAAHPAAMLAPRGRSPHGSSITCGGGPFMPEVSVTATADGATRTFGGSPGCTWPADEAVGVYFDAAEQDSASLMRSSSLLRCDEDPILFSVPTPLASVEACRRGRWTPRTERLIRLAETAPTLSQVQPATLFPKDIGALRCTVPAGGPYPGKKLRGLCGVTVANAPTETTVAFTLDWWAAGATKPTRHIWRVAVRGGRLTGVTQTGPAPPQTWA